MAHSSATESAARADLPAQYWIDQLKLLPHPEGGYFRESYRATELLTQAALPSRFPGSRCFATAIYYLLEADDFSAFHRIRSDETWHFYGGGPLEVHMLDAGNHYCIHLGTQLHLGQHLQWTVPAGTWFASRPTQGTHYSLVGCTVSPGFEFADFELAVASELSVEFPKHGSLIQELTRH